MLVALDYRPALFSRSGIARSVRELVRALAESGPDPELVLFAHAWSTPLESDWRSAVPPHVRVVRSRLPGRLQPALARFGLDARRLAHGAEVFHVTDFVQPPLGRGAKPVLTLHDLAFASDPRFHGGKQSRRLLRRLERLLRRDPVLVFPSTASRDACVDFFGTRPRMHVVPFGADHALRFDSDAERGRRLARCLLGTDEPFVLCLGTIEPRKNHDVLLAAMQLLAERGHALPLLVIGAPGWETASVQQRLRLANERFPMQWLGAFADAQVFDLLRAARVLVYPSSLEGFGFPPLEALELGVPCVVGRCAAIEEQLGDAGIYVTPRSVPELAEALLHAHTNEALRSEKLDAWRARRDTRTWRAAAAGYREAYSDANGA